MIVATCRGQEVIVEGTGFRDDLLVIRWPNGILTREKDRDVTDERVVAEDDDADEG